MNRRKFLYSAVGAGLALTRMGRARADELDEKTQAAVDKGLKWLADQQKSDGHWEANQGQYPSVMTALAGMAMLMEGSTLREGKYTDKIRRAVEWFLERPQSNGALANPANQAEMSRYMYGHGFGTLFLASVYGEEGDERQRKRLEEVLTKACEFSGNAQTDIGGWGYLSAKDGQNFDEGSVTITQMQALRAARNAGIAVNKGIIDKARDYLEKRCTGERGDVLYRPGRSAITPGLTTAGVACMFNAGEYDAPVVKRWLKYIQKSVPAMGAAGRQGHDEYTHYYWAQSLYILGDYGWERMFPGTPESERMTWSKYRAETFPYLLKTQLSEGGWPSMAGSHWANLGPVYVTPMCLAILQLDKGTLPIYQR